MTKTPIPLPPCTIWQEGGREFGNESLCLTLGKVGAIGTLGVDSYHPSS